MPFLQSYLQIFRHRDCAPRYFLYGKALSEARTILGKLNHADLRGYRALWHYLAGAAAPSLPNEKAGGVVSAAPYTRFA